MTDPSKLPITIHEDHTALARSIARRIGEIVRTKPNAVLGLSIPEIVGYLCAPGRNLVKLKGDVLEKLATAAWYLHSNRDGKLFFRNVENLNAKLESLAKAYVREQSLKELRQRLTDLFKPVNGWCYQEVLPLPAIDEINIAADKATLVISEPYMGQGLNPQLKQFFDQTTFALRPTKTGRDDQCLA